MSLVGMHSVPLDEHGVPLQGLDLLYQTHTPVEVRLTKGPLGLKLGSTGHDDEDGTPLGAAVEAIAPASGASGVLVEGDLLGQVVLHHAGAEDERYDVIDVGYADIMGLLKSVARGLKKQRLQATLIAFRGPA